MRHLAFGACSTTLVFVGALFLPTAIAAESATQTATSSDEVVEEIIVTGTRLPINAIAPVTVLTHLDIRRGGANSIGEVLQALPMNAGSPLNTNVNAGGSEPFVGGDRGDGSTRIALRGHSTLVLLNGRRFPNGGLGADASVDLNSIPMAFIERVEVLASGASAIYGADAVGGVVNIVTRREADGVEVSGSQTITAEGDGEIITGQAGIGFDVFDGAWNFGVDYAKQDGVTLDRRSYSAVPLLIVDGDGTLGFAGNLTTPQGHFGVPDGNALRLEPGTYTRVNGASGQTAADYRPFDQAVDGFNYAPFASAIADDSSDPGSEPSDEEIEEIIVTGSRLFINSTAPVTVVSRRDIERGGANSIGDVLQALPMRTGSQLNTNVNLGGAEPFTEGPSGDGSVRVELRGGRTLVLLNGRRFPSEDLNVFPISLVERVEVLPSGASAVYGEGAVGGVINVITRRDVVGFTLAGSQTITEQGDGAITTGQATAGFDAFGGNWILGVDHVKQDGVTLDRRSYSAVPRAIVDGDGTLGPFVDRATPQGRFTVPGGNALGLEPGVYTRVDGASGQTAADYRPFDPATDNFNFAPFNYSQTPNERASAWLIGSHPLSERISLFMEGLVHHRKSTQKAAPDPYFAGREPAATLANGLRGIPTDNYYNPFGVDLSWSPGSLPVGRRLVELGDRTVREEVDLWRVLVGLEGGVADWAWTLSVTNAESDGSTVETGVALRERLALAVGPSGRDETGRIVCGPPEPTTGRVPATSIIPGCVPLNLFGGVGSITPEQLDYISARPMRHADTSEEQTAELILSGPWGQLSGQDLHWVLGADYRRDWQSRELFAEVQVPLLRGWRWAREIDLNVGLRWSDASTLDNHLSGQAGLRWQPAEEWTLRANYADVFNAPAFEQLHEPRVSENGFDIDPCGNEPTDRQRANCAANGVPGGAYEQGGESFVVRHGGNPDVEPEMGYSVGAGVMYSPGWAEGLSASVDFFQGEISNLIWGMSVEEALFECAEHRVRQACDGIKRFPDGSIEQVSTFPENFWWPYEIRGVDFTIDWPGTTPFGDVNSRLLATYLERWDERFFSNGELLSYAGTFGAGAMPHWRGLATVDWLSGRWIASYAAEYIGSYTQRVESTPFGAPFDPFTWRIEPVLYHDIEGQYAFENGITVRVAITNLTDEDPPFVNLASPANTDAGTYRLLGRSYFLELRYDSANGSE